MDPDATAVIGRVFREHSGKAVAVLTRLLGDIDAAEEAVQDAFVTALARWPADGIPPSPPGWIVTTARNRAIDRIRRERTRTDRYVQAALLRDDSPAREEGPVPDDRSLSFMPETVPETNRQDGLGTDLDQRARPTGGFGDPQHVDLQHRVRDALGDFLTEPTGTALAMVRKAVRQLIAADLGCLATARMSPDDARAVRDSHRDLTDALDELLRAHPGSDELSRRGHAFRHLLLAHFDLTSSVSPRRWRQASLA